MTKGVFTMLDYLLRVANTGNLKLHAVAVGSYKHKLRPVIDVVHCLNWIFFFVFIVVLKLLQSRSTHRYLWPSRTQTLIASSIVRDIPKEGSLPFFFVLAIVTEEAGSEDDRILTPHT